MGSYETEKECFCVINQYFDEWINKAFDFFHSRQLKLNSKTDLI